MSLKESLRSTHYVTCRNAERPRLEGVNWQKTQAWGGIHVLSGRIEIGTIRYHDSRARTLKEKLVKRESVQKKFRSKEII